MSGDDDFPSRKWNERRDKYISVLLARLAELEKQTNPAGGDETAKGKDLAAFDALQTAGELVRAVAGWALDHQFGLASQGLQFIPLQPSGTKDHAEYLEQRARVDSHEHECNGAAASRNPTVEPDIVRRLLINLLLPNPGAFPFCVQQNTIEALRVLEFGEVLPLLRQKNNAAKRGYRELCSQLRALGFVEYRWKLGQKEYVARQAVAQAFGVSSETLRTWKRRLKEEFGHLEVSRTLSFARNLATHVLAAREGGPAYKAVAERAEQAYGDSALEAAAQAYRDLLGFSSV